MAKKNQQQASGNRHQASGATGLRSEAAPQDESAVAVAEEVAEVQGSEAAAPIAPPLAPLTRIGPSASLSVGLDDIAHIAERRKQSREDAAGALRAHAKDIASGIEPTAAVKQQIAELLEVAGWPMAMFKNECDLAAQRHRTRQELDGLPKAQKDLEAARERLAVAKEERDRIVREAEAVVTEHHNRVLDAESRVRVGTSARKALLDSAPATIKTQLAKARAALSATTGESVRQERTATEALRAMNEAKAAVANTIADSAEYQKASVAFVNAESAYEEQMATLTLAKERITEIQNDIEELTRLAELA